MTVVFGPNWKSVMPRTRKSLIGVPMCICGHELDNHLWIGNMNENLVLGDCDTYLCSCKEFIEIPSTATKDQIRAIKSIVTSSVSP